MLGTYEGLYNILIILRLLGFLTQDNGSPSC